MLFPTALAWLLYRQWRHWARAGSTPMPVAEERQEPLPRVVWVGLAIAMVWALAALSFLWWLNALLHHDL